jgi:putative transposase
VEIRKKRLANVHGYIQWRWRLGEVFVNIHGKLRYLWRAVDHEEEVLEIVVTVKRDKAAALTLPKRIMKSMGAQQPRHRRLCSYSAATKEIGAASLQDRGQACGGDSTLIDRSEHHGFRSRFVG